MQSRNFILLSVLVLLSCQDTGKTTAANTKVIIKELSSNEIASGDGVIVMVGATLIDGNGGQAVQNSCVIVGENKIDFAGKSNAKDAIKAMRQVKKVMLNGVWIGQ